MESNMTKAKGAEVAVAIQNSAIIGAFTGVMDTLEKDTLIY
jgi:hypothetical protein